MRINTVALATNIGLIGLIGFAIGWTGEWWPMAFLLFLRDATSRDDEE